MAVTMLSILLAFMFLCLGSVAGERRSLEAGKKGAMSLLPPNLAMSIGKKGAPMEEDMGAAPSAVPTASMSPSTMPSISFSPTMILSSTPSKSLQPSELPSNMPSFSSSPSITPSSIPSESVQPSQLPSAAPSLSTQPSNQMCQIRLIVGCRDFDNTEPGIIECASIPALDGSNPEECMRRVRFSYLIFNDGTEPFNLVVADRTRTTVDPISGSFLQAFPSTTIPGQGMVSRSETVTIDRCTQFTSTTTVMVEAEPESGPGCSAEATYELSF